MIKQFRCPTCHESLTLDQLCCSNGHFFNHDKNGVLSLLDEKTAAELAPFAKTIAQKRRDGNYPLFDPAVYDNLPCAGPLQANKEWQWRCDEVSIVKEIIGRHVHTSQHILDVGAYNGWLSHHLASDGHQVTAVDYFKDEHDGLGAVKHYTNEWQAIQLDLVDLSPLDQQFDIVIMNHGLQFFPNPISYIRHLSAKVTPGGLLILLGIIIYRNPTPRKRYLARAQQQHQALYGRPMLFRPAAGYLDYHDYTEMTNLNINLQPYGRFQIINFLSKMIPTLPWRGYGIKNI